MNENLQDKEALAAEYALGTLDQAERRRAKSLIVRDQAFADMVSAWEKRLAPMADDIEAVAPPEGVWTAIEHELGPGISPTKPANQNRPFWKGFVTAALAASVMFLAIGGTLFTRLQAPEPTLIAVLLDPESNPGAIVEALGGDQVRIVPLVDIAVPEGQTLEVWTLPDPDAGPVSLGTFEQPRSTDLGGWTLPNPKADQLYEISLEPAGGSPVGRPTGPVLFKGFAKQPL